MKIMGYARVSTSGQTLAAQLDQLGPAGCDQVLRKSMSGVRGNRPKLKDAITALSEGNMLIVTRLDRLVPATSNLQDIVHTIETRGAKLKALTNSWADTTTPTGKLGAVHLETSSIRRIIKAAARRAGLVDEAVHLSGHSMRVGEAEDLMRASHDTIAIMTAGGWKTVGVVARYVERTAFARLRPTRPGLTDTAGLQP